MTENRSRNSILRMLDAAANRTSEGLRVVEDVSRWHVEDANLAAQLKTLRHELGTLIEQLLGPRGFRMRDADEDVGRQIEVASEYDRAGAAGQSGRVGPPLAIANFKRAAQGLRTIEELAKLIDVAAAKSAETMRYRTYTLERAVLTAMTAGAIEAPSLYVLVDAGDWPAHCGPEQREVGEQEFEASTLAADADRLVEAGVEFIQLRDKRLTDRQLVAAGSQLARRLKSTRTRLVINDRADLALACGATVVHLGQEDLHIADARRLVGPDMLIGVSTHSAEQARQAAMGGADYIAVGPVFPSGTKSFEQYVGPELVAQVVAETSLPVFAIGGIGTGNDAQIAAAGCHRIAVSGAFDRQAGRERWGDIADELRQALVEPVAAEGG